MRERLDYCRASALYMMMEVFVDGYWRSWGEMGELGELAEEAGETGWIWVWVWVCKGVVGLVEIAEWEAVVKKAERGKGEPRLI